MFMIVSIDYLLHRADQEMGLVHTNKEVILILTTVSRRQVWIICRVWSLWECGLWRSGISVGVVYVRYSLGGDVVFCVCGISGVWSMWGTVSVRCNLCGLWSL